jgi:8-oxo-dGTP pyrophosphatase MutT (NUDIX family)
MQKKTILAGGGLVLNDRNELLLIFRRGKWDLPKGKLDEGETMEACALREVMEETGIKALELDAFVGKTFHEYFDKWLQEEVIKETWWYAMRTASEQALLPQAEEDIEHAIWADETTLNECLTNSYPNILDIVSVWRTRH